MTAQVTEKLIYQGKSYDMCTNPLGSLLKQRGFGRLVSPHTACWRGYVGTWTVESDALYLTDIKAYVRAEEGDDSDRQIWGMAELFPEASNGVFAHWYSGEVRCPMGKRLQYVHAGYQSQYEFDLFLNFKLGRLMDRRTVINGNSDDPNATNGYSVNALTKF